MTDRSIVGRRNPAIPGLVHYRFWGRAVGLDDFTVLRFEAAEELNRPYRFTIDLHARTELADAELLLGRPATLAPLQDELDFEVHGIVERIEIRDPRARGDVRPHLVRIRMSSDDDVDGITLDANGSCLRMTEDSVEITVGQSNVLLTDAGIHVNNNSFPSGSGQ